MIKNAKKIITDDRLFFTEAPDVGIDITNRCNLLCRHCYNDSGRTSVQELLLEDLVTLFKQLQEIGQRTLHLSGGEPTLHPDFPLIVNEAQHYGMRISISTNGNYSEAVRRQLCKLKILRSAVSLEGMRKNNDRIRGDGVFDQVVHSIPFLKSISSEVILVVHVSRSNLRDIESLIRLARELEIDIKFATLRPIGRAEQILKNEIPTPQQFLEVVRRVTKMRRLYPNMMIKTDFDILAHKKVIYRLISPEKASCPAGRSRLNIHYDGTIYPCSFLVTPDRKFAVGHISDGPILEMWRNSPLLTAFRTMRRSSSCQNCEAYGNACVGGCVAMSYLLTGDLNARDPLCFVDYLENSQGY